MQARNMSPKRPKAVSAALFAATVLAVGVAAADEGTIRYVTEQGRDKGDCSLPVQPCRTIAYALSVASKGDAVRVAAGAYRVETAEDVFELASGALDVQGGFDRFDHFLTQSPTANPTFLAGVPPQYRDRLRGRGFEVVADGKGLADADEQAQFQRGFAANQAAVAKRQVVSKAAGEFGRSAVTLLAKVPLESMWSKPSRAMDIWGLIDLNTEREYALVGHQKGLAVFDVTDPGDPFQAGYVPGPRTNWRDIKALQRYDADAERWRAYVFVGGERSADNFTVVDFDDLSNPFVLGNLPPGMDWSHNVHVTGVDPSTAVAAGTAPLLYLVGGRQNGGAFRAYSLGNPLLPAAAFQAPELDNYSHDVAHARITDERASACQDPDTCNVLFDFNESEIKIWDLSAAEPRLLSTWDPGGDASKRYVHSGWATEDGRWLLMHDEYDERKLNQNTAVRVFDLADLLAPKLAGTWTGPTPAIDHNGFTRGNRYYMSNYARGLTVLDITNPASPTQAGYFDTHPTTDGASFLGAWGVYPFLPSGNLLVSDIGAGLFVLGDRTRTSANGQLAFTAAAYGGVEGNTVTVSVTRSAGTAGAVSVDYAVTAGSATAADFTASQGTLAWAADEAGTRSIEVPLLSDAESEPVERAFVRLANPTGGAALGDASLASVFIGDANATAAVGFAETRITVDEGQRAVVAVRRLGSPAGAVEVDYTLAPGTASASTDYRAAASGTLSWADGDARTKTFVVTALADDVTPEPTESFEVRLGTPSGAVIDGTATVEVAIEDLDDAAVRGLTLFSRRLNRADGTDLALLRDGMTVPRHQAEQRFGTTFLELRAVVRGTADSVTFELSDGETTRRKTDNEAPYTMPMPTKSGNYTVTATPHPDEDGPAGTALRVAFTVDTGSNRPATGAPTITQDSSVGLRASTSNVADPDGLSNAGLAFQWLWSDGDAEEVIPLDPHRDYNRYYYLSKRDDGRDLRVEVRFVDDAGHEESLLSEEPFEVDQPPTLTIEADGPAIEGGNATFTITADPAPEEHMHVDVQVSQGPNDDYLPDRTPSWVHIEPGAAKTTLSIALPEDDVDEPDGIVTATLDDESWRRSYYLAPGGDTASLTVRDKNALPTLAIAAGEAATEGGAAAFTITAVPAPAADLAVSVSLTQGTDDDYLPDAPPTSVTLSAGATTATLSVALPDDAVDEPDGTITATIAENSDKYGITTASATLSVRDDDLPSLSIAAGESATEGGTATFTITADPAPHADLSVAVAVTEADGSDFLPDAPPTSVIIPAGAGSATLSVPLPDDAADEPNGTVTATISESDGYEVATATASLAVHDNDVPTLSIAAGAAVTEGGTATFTITADQAPAADLGVSVSVTQGADDEYLPATPPTAVTIAAGATTATLSVALPDDAVDEPDGTVTATIAAKPDSYDLATASASLTVRDNDLPSLSIAASEATTEGGAATFTITADPAPHADLAVKVAVTEAEGSSFLPDAPPTSVTIPAGAGSATLSVPLPDDAADEPNGTVTATISESDGYEVATATASLAVHDNDVPTLSIAAGAAVTEGGTATFTITADQAPAADLGVSVSVTQGADDDYLPDAPPSSVMIAAGETTATLSVALPDDAVDEADGTVTATITENSDRYDLATASASLTVRDDDVPSLSIAAGGTATEGGAATFTITADPAPHADLAVAVAVTEAEGSDFLPEAPPTSVTIPAGAKTATLSVSLPDDAVVEADGTVTATLSEGEGYAVATATASLTVSNDDVPSLSITAGTAATEGGTATFTITAAPAPAADLEVTVAVTQGGEDDYLPNAPPTALTIAAGVTTATLSVALPDDAVDEADGTVTATIAENSDKYGITTASATLAVRDDDLPSLSIAAGGSATEGGTATFTITADPAPHADLSVAVAVTEADGSDFLPDSPPTAVTIAAGATTATLSVALPDDTAVEADGTVTATLSEGEGYAVATAAASLAVSDDDVPSLSIEAGEPVTEGGTATFTITADQAPLADLAVSVSVTQGADDDYLPDAPPTSVTVAAGATEAILSVTLPDDKLDEPDGVIQATIAASPDYDVTVASTSLTVRDDDVALTAEFRGVPKEHWGKGFEFEFELLFSEFLVQRLSSATLREDALQATNATVTHARRVVKRDNRHWRITVRPDAGAEVTVTLPVTTDCDATGALCTEDGRPLSNSLSATVVAGPPLTAAFVGMPGSHDGRSLFEFELRFSEDFPGRLPYKLLRDEAFEVTNGRVRKAGRVEPGQNQRWTIAVQPGSHEAVTVTLPATADCAAPGAVCTEAGRPLSKGASATVEGPAPLTAAFHGMPAEHDGRTSFEFELRFSVDFPGRLPYKLLRDEAFRVTNGSVVQARRAEQNQNQRWMIEVQPDSHEAVTVTLPATTDCAAPGAVCTEGGRPLSSGASATVAGAVEDLAFADGADRQRRVEPHRPAGFLVGAPVAAAGPEPLAWSVDDPKGLIDIDASTGQLRMAVDGEAAFELLDNGRFRYQRTDVEYLSLVFKVTVTVTDWFGRTVDAQVPVRVAADEPGDVALSTFEPQAGREISASVSDPDGVRAGSVGWQWEYDDGNWVDDGGGWFVPVWRQVSGATTNTLTPSTDMAGYELRAVATYADWLSGPGEPLKQAASAPTDEVTLANAKRAAR